MSSYAAEEPGHDLRAVAGVFAWGLGLCVFIENLYAASVRTAPVRHSVGFLIWDCGYWAFLPVGLTIGLMAAPLAGARWAVAWASALFVALVASESRGNWIWPGTFDNYNQSRWPWLGALSLGVSAGLLIPPRFAGAVRTGRWPAVAGIVALALGATWGALQERTLDMITDFAATRSFVLYPSLLVLACLYLFGERQQ